MMRTVSLAAVWLLAAAPMAAQVAVRLGVGVTGATPLADDVAYLTDVISLKSGVAPTVALSVAHPFADGKYHVRLEGRFTTASLTSTTADGEREVTDLRTLALTAFLEGRLRGNVRWQVGGGQLLYRPAERRGVFRDDAPAKWLAAAGASWTRPIGRDLELVVNARWDMHEFSTLALRRAGWSLGQTVHRVGLTLGAERRF